MKIAAPPMNPKVDAYIAKAQPFAQPILARLRKLAHKASPDVQEEIKWGIPFFVLRGVILGHIAAFKQHCSVGFWGPEMQAILKADGIQSDGGMGSIGRIASLKDLPPDKVLLGYYRQAAIFIDSGQRTKSFTRGPKKTRPAPEVPAELAIALKKNKTAAKVFAEFTANAQGEYSNWIAEAKRPETKVKRVAQAVEWIAEGKQRNWKYQNC
ncbi:MAG TPA: YdeI/OmpD-associated family protein [Edaphobacter sp.]|nr:YdeI/OmpD-associated family protein [Edaphobacter sp.]